MEMVSDSLHLPHEEAQPLAKAIHKKTAGNPLFASRFLEQLYRYISGHSTWVNGRGEVRSANNE